MTAGVVKSKPAPRCGCCDASDPIAICERCEEPMCARHLESVRVPGDVQFVCTICREAFESHPQRGAAGAVA